MLTVSMGILTKRELAASIPAEAGCELVLRSIPDSPWYQWYEISVRASSYTNISTDLIRYWAGASVTASLIYTFLKSSSVASSRFHDVIQYA